MGRVCSQKGHLKNIYCEYFSFTRTGHKIELWKVVVVVAVSVVAAVVK